MNLSYKSCEKPAIGASLPFLDPRRILILAKPENQPGSQNLFCSSSKRTMAKSSPGPFQALVKTKQSEERTSKHIISYLTLYRITLYRTGKWDIVFDRQVFADATSPFRGSVALV